MVLVDKLYFELKILTSNTVTSHAKLEPLFKSYTAQIKRSKFKKTLV